MTNYLDRLATEIPVIRQLEARSSGADRFFAQEVLRFYSIAGTLLAFEDFSLDEKSSAEERYITHILSRSLLENYFWILYLFDDPAKTSSRYEELKNSFKRDYLKLWNESQLPHKSELLPAEPSWASLARAPDLNSMLAQLRNDYGDRLNYLYFVYRVASFDTHGKSLPAVLEDSFGRKCNFPVLKIRRAFELVANQYLIVANDLRSRDVD